MTNPSVKEDGHSPLNNNERSNFVAVFSPKSSTNKDRKFLELYDEAR